MDLVFNMRVAVAANLQFHSQCATQATSLSLHYLPLSLSLSACLPVRPLSSACPVMQFSCLVLLPVHTQFVPPLPPPPRSLLGLAVALNALSLLFVFNKFCVLSCLVYAACCLCVRVRVSVCSNICSLSGTGHCHAHCPFHAT